MQTYSNENGKDLMIYNDITCAGDYLPSVDQRNARNFADTSDLLDKQ